jgi:hypothetical protein
LHVIIHDRQRHGGLPAAQAGQGRGRERVGPDDSTWPVFRAE